MKLTAKKVTALCLGLAIVAMMGCGTSAPTGTPSATQPSSGEKVKIKFLHKWPQPENKAYFDEVIAAYEAANPNVDIVDEAVADEPIKDKLRVLMGSTDQPDIFFSWSGEFANKFINAGSAYDLTSAMTADGGAWGNSLMKAGTEPFTKDGKMYGVPLRINGKFFAYNKTIFDKYGLTAPTTWEEFLKTCETLKENGVVPISFGNQFPWAACHYITGLNQKMVPQDVRIKDYNKATGEFTDPGYVQALNMFKELGDKGYFNEYPNSTSHDMANENFAQGKAAMIYIELEELSTCNEKQNGNPWDFFPMPSITDGKGSQNFLVGAPDGFMVSANSKHPDIAIDFLKFLTNMENGQRMVKMLKWPSPVIGAATPDNSPAFLIKGMEAVQSADGMALWLDTDIHVKISDTYLPGLQEILNGTVTPEQLMKNVQKVAKEVQTLPE